jgi:hypothetical protein
MSRKTATAIASIIGLAAVVIAVVALMGAARENRHAGDIRLLVEVCLRNNITKGVLRVNEQRRLDLVERLGRGPGGDHGAVAVAQEGVTRVNAMQQILNCERSFGSDGGVPLDPGVQEKYLDLIREGWVPELDTQTGGRIVGRHRPEEEGFADF